MIWHRSAARSAQSDALSDRGDDALQRERLELTETHQRVPVRPLYKAFSGDLHADSSGLGDYGQPHQDCAIAGHLTSCLADEGGCREVREGKQALLEGAR